MEHKFRLKHTVRKNRTTFSEIPLLVAFFLPEGPEKSCSVSFPTGFPENVFVSGKQPLLMHALPGSICVFLMFFFLTMFLSLMELTLEI